jgi:hypothetical protein
MPVSDHELTLAVALIDHDLAATLDWDPRRVATLAEELVGVGVSVDGWDAAWGSYAIKLAEDVQQHLHDTFVHRPGRPARCTHSIPSGSTASTTVPSGAAPRRGWTSSHWAR